MFYLFSFALALPSPVLGFVISAEAWAVFVGLAGTRMWAPVALVLAAGQCVTFALLFTFGGALLRRFPRLQAQVDRIDLARFSKQRYGWLLVGAVVGLPPVVGLALLAPASKVRLAPFLGIAFAGRALRFGLLAGLPRLFSGWFDVNVIPASIRAFA